MLINTILIAIAITNLLKHPFKRTTSEVLRTRLKQKGCLSVSENRQTKSKEHLSQVARQHMRRRCADTAKLPCYTLDAQTDGTTRL